MLRNHTKDTKLRMGQKVQFRVYYSKVEKRKKGYIKERLSTCMYLIASQGNTFKRHIDQIVKLVANKKENESDIEADIHI